MNTPPTITLAWRSHKGGGTRGLEAYSDAQNSAKNAPKPAIFKPKNENFSGLGAQPNPFPVGWGSSPYLTPQMPPLQLDPGYATEPSHRTVHRHKHSAHDETVILVFLFGYMRLPRG